MQKRTLVGFIFALAGMAAVAQEDTPWTPDAPAMPDKLDWLQLPSGEWLAGSVTVLYDETLDFDSEEMDDLSFDWSDVKQLRTAQVLQVRTVDQTTAIGKVLIKDGKLTVLADPQVVFDQNHVLAIIAGRPRERNYWSGLVAASSNFRSGNTEQTDVNIRAGVQRRTVQQRMVADYLSNYNETDGEATANNYRLSGNWDRFVSDRMYWSPLVAEYYRDRFQNLEHRMTIGAGVGYQLIDTARTGWRVSAGPAYQKTWFVDVPPGGNETESSPAFVGETRFEHELNSDIDIFYDYSFQITSRDNGRYNHHMEGGISIEIFGDLDFQVTYVWDRIEEPQPDEEGVRPEKDDYQLLLGLGYTF